MSDDPSATYRGFRSQALYVLYRLLTDPNRGELVFRPEGDEDLAIFDRNGAFVETVQVKDHSSPLTLSDLKYKSSQGFFGRLRARISLDPECTTKIATYGPLGPELGGAIRNEEKPRRDVIRKIKSASDWKDEDEIAGALQSLEGNIEILDREKLTSQISETLRGKAIGGDLEVVIDLLMYWIFDSSEKARYITESLLVEKIQAIGEFLVDSRDFSEEWGTSIESIRPVEIPDQRRKELVSEYRRGVDARFDHILAEADSPRHDLLAELRDVLVEHSVAIVRGASGQGKSSLGWRFLHDHCADGLRFQIRNLESRKQAMRIANALASHVRKLRLPATVLLDVSPSTVGWPELAKEFSKAGIRTLVCVREEDFLRGGVGEFQFDYGVVLLQQIGKTEAEGIYESLVEPGESVPLNFEDAWSRFEENGGGPLMEFTHLIAAGDSLSSRMGLQISRIRSDAETDGTPISSAHLKLLALAAIANAAGARISYVRLCDEVGLDRITDPIRLIEKEYLFRIVEDSGESVIAGLHAIRSRAILDAIFADDGEMMSDYAVEVLRLVVDSDIRSYLLFAFAEERISSTRILVELNSLKPRSWAHVCGICEALMWYGVDAYERANRETLERVIQKHKRAWLIACDISIGLDEKSNGLAEKLPNYDSSEAELTPKKEVFRPLKGWLENASAPEPFPGDDELGGLGDLMFWAGFTGTEGAIPKVLRDMEIDVGSQPLQCGDLGRWVIGKSEIAPDVFQEWHESKLEKIRSRFLVETHSVDLSDDGSELAVMYALTPVNDKDSRSITTIDSNLNSATMTRVNLLRLLYPDRDLFCGKAFGGASLQSVANFDESEKKIPFSTLRAPLGVQLNANFRNLVSYRHERVESWKDYVAMVIAYRKSAISFSEKIVKYWNRMLGAPPNRRAGMSGYPSAEKTSVTRMDFPPKLPKVAVDHFGFAEDHVGERSRGADVSGKEGAPSERSDFIEKFSCWLEILRDYSSYLSSFAGHSEEISVRFQSGILDFSQSDGEIDLGHLALVCASETFGALEQMQKEFRQHFEAYVGDSRLKQIEHKERAAMEKLWAVAVAMQYHRSSVEKNLSGRVLSRLKAKQARFPNALESPLDRGEDRRISISQHRLQLGGDSCLVAVCDYPDMATLEQDSGTLVEDCAAAVRAQSWRKFEWQCVVSNWPMVAFIKTIKGKAWSPLAAKIPTAILMMSGDEFFAKSHHRALCEIPGDDFNRTGVTLHEHPVISSLAEVQGALLIFAVAVEIHMEILEYVSEKQLPNQEVQRITTGYLDEVGKARDAFASSCDYAAAIISQSGGRHRGTWKKDIETTKRESIQTLETDLFSPIPRLTPKEVVEGHTRFLAGLEGFRKLFAKVIETVLH